MFIMSMKVNKKAIAAVAIGVAALIIALAFIITSSAMPGGAGASQVYNASSAEIEDGEDLLEYIGGKGLTSDGSVSVKEVIIPEEFDEVYKAYNDLQKENGYDLEKYRGKRVKLWSAGLTGYQDKADGTVYINVLTYKNVVIGGDVSSTELGGFIAGI